MTCHHKLSLDVVAGTLLESSEKRTISSDDMAGTGSDKTVNKKGHTASADTATPSCKMRLITMLQLNPLFSLVFAQPGPQV